MKKKPSFVDLFEKAFGPAPKEGVYNFKSIDVEVVDNKHFKGFVIHWLCEGVGFGEYFFGWGLNPEYVSQLGFHSSSEYMAKEFIEQLMKAALPEITDLVIKADRDK